MKKKKINIDLSYSNSDTNMEFNTDKVEDELILNPKAEMDDVYDDLGFLDQYKDTTDEDDDFAGQ
jgi:hypothetical protein